METEAGTLQSPMPRAGLVQSKDVLQGIPWRAWLKQPSQEASPIVPILQMGLMEGHWFKTCPEVGLVVGEVWELF